MSRCDVPHGDGGHTHAAVLVHAWFLGRSHRAQSTDCDWRPGLMCMAHDGLSGPCSCVLRFSPLTLQACPDQMPWYVGLPLMAAIDEAAAKAAHPMPTDSSTSQALSWSARDMPLRMPVLVSGGSGQWTVIRACLMLSAWHPRHDMIHACHASSTAFMTCWPAWLE